MPRLEVPEPVLVNHRVCEIFKAWTGREKDYLTLNQVAVATGLRASHILGPLGAMVDAGVLEETPIRTNPQRYRVNARPTPQQLQQKLQIIKAIEASSSHRNNDFAY